MSQLHSERSYTHLYVVLKCPCGTDLRVKRALAGTEVRCWSCHQMVRVPLPRTEGMDFRLLYRGFGEAVRGWPAMAICLGAALLTGALAIPRAGIPVAAALVVVGAYAYGDWVRRAGTVPVVDAEADAEESDKARTHPGRHVLRVVTALVVGLAVVSPWLLQPAGWGRPVRLSPPVLAGVLLGSAVLPLIMLAVFGEADGQPVGFARTAALAGRHVLAIVVAIAIVPIGILFTECVSFAFTSLFGWLQLFLLDLFPGPEAMLKRVGLAPLADYADIRFPPPPFFRMYFIRLGQGYSLLGAVPASLPLLKNSPADRWSLLETPESYMMRRATITLMMATLMILTFAIQARWLGLLSQLVPRRAPQA